MTHEFDDQDLPRYPESRSPAVEGWGVAASVLGALSWVAAVAAVLCLLAGPFTCFMTWIWLLYAAWLIVPLHGLTLLAGFAVLATRPPGAAAPAGATLALTAGSIGLAPYLFFLVCYGAALLQ